MRHQPTQNAIRISNLSPRRQRVTVSYSWLRQQSLLTPSLTQAKNQLARSSVNAAWINETNGDVKDREVASVGYEINFNRYFYKYQPPCSLEAIEDDIKAVEADVLKLLQEVAG